MTHFLERPGGRIAFDDSGGSGRPLILLPGIGDLRAEYRFLAPRLEAAGHRVVVADLRGQGASSAGWPDYGLAAVAADLIALIDHLGGAPATVIGTSFAPAAAIWAAAEAPGKIDRLVLISPHLEAGGRVLAALLKLLLRGPWGVRVWLRLYASWYPGRPPADLDGYLDALAASLRGPGRLAALRALLSASRAGLEERLLRVRVPALVVMGAADDHFPDPAAEGRRVAARLGGDLHLVAGAGHYPHAEYPEQVAPALLSFLAASRAPVGA